MEAALGGDASAIESLLSLPPPSLATPPHVLVALCLSLALRAPSDLRSLCARAVSSLPPPCVWAAAAASGAARAITSYTSLGAALDGCPHASPPPVLKGVLVATLRQERTRSSSFVSGVGLACAVATRAREVRDAAAKTAEMCELLGPAAASAGGATLQAAAAMIAAAQRDAEADVDRASSPRSGRRRPRGRAGGSPRAASVMLEVPGARPATAMAALDALGDAVEAALARLTDANTNFAEAGHPLAAAQRGHPCIPLSSASALLEPAARTAARDAAVATRVRSAAYREQALARSGGQRVSLMVAARGGGRGGTQAAADAAATFYDPEAYAGARPGTTVATVPDTWVQVDPYPDRVESAAAANAAAAAAAPAAAPAAPEGVADDGSKGSLPLDGGADAPAAPAAAPAATSAVADHLEVVVSLTDGSMTLTTTHLEWKPSRCASALLEMARQHASRIGTALEANARAATPVSPDSGRGEDDGGEAGSSGHARTGSKFGRLWSRYRQLSSPRAHGGDVFAGADPLFTVVRTAVVADHNRKSQAEWEAFQQMLGRLEAAAAAEDSAEEAAAEAAAEANDGTALSAPLVRLDLASVTGFMYGAVQGALNGASDAPGGKSKPDKNKPATAGIATGLLDLHGVAVRGGGAVVSTGANDSSSDEYDEDGDDDDDDDDDRDSGSDNDYGSDTASVVSAWRREDKGERPAFDVDKNDRRAVEEQQQKQRASVTAQPAPARKGKEWRKKRAKSKAAFMAATGTKRVGEFDDERVPMYLGVTCGGRVYRFFPFFGAEVHGLLAALSDLTGLQPTSLPDALSRLLSHAHERDRREVFRALCAEEDPWIAHSEPLTRCVEALTAGGPDGAARLVDLERLYHSCRLNHSVAREAIRMLREVWDASESDASRVRVLVTLHRLTDDRVLHSRDEVFRSLVVWFKFVESETDPYRSPNSVKLLSEIRKKVAAVRSHTLHTVADAQLDDVFAERARFEVYRKRGASPPAARSFAAGEARPRK